MHNTHSLSWHIATNIRYQLVRMGIRQQDLATLLNEGHWWVSRRLKGRTPCTLEDLERIAAALNVPPWALLQEARELAA